MKIDAYAYRDFPLLVEHKKRNPSFCYFDNAATTHVSQYVLDAMHTMYRASYGPVARSIYPLAEEATQHYAQARARIAAFVGAASDEIIFTSGATAGINAIAFGWALQTLKSGDEIVLTQLEHHANLLPWQQIAQRVGVILKYIPVLPSGKLDYASLGHLITGATKLVSITHCSNAIGTPVDVARIAQRAHAVGALVLVDAAQTVPHGGVCVNALGADMLVFSGHKMGGPTGIGVLYIRRAVQKNIMPWVWGGGMVTDVDWDRAVLGASPERYEAGTPPVVQAVGLAAAVEYLDRYTTNAIQSHEAALCTQLVAGIAHFSQVTFFGPAHNATHMVSFSIDGMHAHDVAAYLAMHGICVRAGTHCAHPLAKTLKYGATVRISFYLYNTHEEVEHCVAVLSALLTGGSKNFF